jgi:hypothetical protein
MSLLEYDIKMSMYSKYMQISRMPKEEKEKLQAKHIKKPVENALMRVEKGETWGRSYLKILPNWYYPYGKMIKDVNKALDENGIILEHTYILCQGDAKLACCFSWSAKN